MFAYPSTGMVNHYTPKDIRNLNLCIVRNMQNAQTQKNERSNWKVGLDPRKRHWFRETSNYSLNWAKPNLEAVGGWRKNGSMVSLSNHPSPSAIRLNWIFCYYISMGPWVVSLMFSIGVSGWVYTQLQRRGGASNPKQTAIGTAVVFLFVLFVSYFIFNMFL